MEIFITIIFNTMLILLKILIQKIYNIKDTIYLKYDKKMNGI
jgi:hypothetical protein